MKRYDGYYINGSGYRDPTAGDACFRIDQERGKLEADAPKKPKYHLAWTAKK